MKNFIELSEEEFFTTGSGLISGMAGTIIGVCFAAPIAAVIAYASGASEKGQKAAALAAASVCITIGVVSPLP